MITGKTVFLGFYLGLGDFISAMPVINRLLAKENRLTVAVSRQNRILSEAIRFHPGQLEIV